MQVVQGQHVMEGAGVKICRTVGTSGLRNLDPFLMLDELRLPASQATAGFPDHPHREHSSTLDPAEEPVFSWAASETFYCAAGGMETCSILLSGKIEHKDSVGNHVRH